MNMFARTRCHKHVSQDEVPWVCFTGRGAMNMFHRTKCHECVWQKRGAINMFDRTRCHECVWQKRCAINMFNWKTEMPWTCLTGRGANAMNMLTWQLRCRAINAFDRAVDLPWTSVTDGRRLPYERVPHYDWGAMNVSHTANEVPWTCPTLRLRCHERVPRCDWGAMNVSHTARCVSVFNSPRYHELGFSCEVQ